MKRKRYSRKFPRKAVERMRTCENVARLAEELGATPRCLYKWRRKLDLAESGEEMARPSTHEASFRKQAQQLKRLLAEKVLEVDFSEVPCKKSRLDASGAAVLARRHLRANPGSDAAARRPEYRAHV
ncbi:MAG TPA: transposase [Terriglobia bacterium]|nr:transposase [Terriglobia bacterium]